MSDGETPEVEYRVIERELEINPDDPLHPMWEAHQNLVDLEGEDLIEAKSLIWFNLLKEQFESFEHHRNSSIFEVYGHDYAKKDERTMNLKEIVAGEYSGGVDYRWWASLQNALEYRLTNFGTRQGGWSVFDNIKGDYEVSIIDKSVLELRDVKLTEFLALLNSDNKLTKFDPETNKEAITMIDPATNKMGGIEYFFAFGKDNTNEVNYTVLEPMVEEGEDEVEQSVTKLARYFACKDIIEHEEETSVGRIVGKIVAVRDDLKKGGKQLVSQIRPTIEEMNLLFQKEGIDAIEGVMVSLGVIKTKKGKGTLKEGVIVETSKSISPKALIRKASSQSLIDKLNNLRPPDKDGGAGTDWPRSKGGKYYIWITNDALEVLTKTTGRAWGSKTKSCENWDGNYKQGPASDIKYGNCVVYIYSEERNPHKPLANQIGRMSARWGDAYRKEKKKGQDIGLEQQTYPKNAAWGLNMATAILKLSKDAGLLDYERCMTPYESDAYSDYAGRRGQIIYEKPKLVGHGDIQIVEYDFIATARNPTISHQRVGHVLTFGKDIPGIYSALAQNPVLWIYPNPMNRFLKNIRGHIDVTELMHELLDSELADFSFFDYVINNIVEYDPFYQEYDRSIVNSILNHPNCTPEIHRTLGKEFPGYITQTLPLRVLGYIDEIVYLNLMSPTNHYDVFCPPHLCTAPEDVLDELVEKVLAGRLPKWDIRRVKYTPPLPIAHPDTYDTSSADVDFYWLHHEYLSSIRNLIFAPSLSNHAFLRLMESFTKFHESLDTDYQDKYPQTSKLIQRTIDDFINCVCLPLREENDYGYTDELNGLHIGLGEINVKFRYHLEDRQSAESAKMLYKLAPQVLEYSTDPILQQNMPRGYSSLLQRGMLVENIRTHSVYSLLWNMKERFKGIKGVSETSRWGISPFVFLNKYVNRKNHNKAGDYVFIDSDQFITAVKELDESQLPLLIYDFKPYVVEKRTERTTVPSGVVSELVSDTDLMYQIGVNWVALWIEDVDDFYAFENALMDIIGSPIDSEADFVAWATGLGDTHVLSQAACGSSSLEGGLVENPHLPIDLLERMILPATVEDYGDRKWSSIDEVHQGGYTEFLHPILSKVIGNEASSGEILLWIIENHPEHIDKIATNPNAPMIVLRRMKEENPLGLLHNTGLDQSLLQETIERVIEMLLISPPKDPERFYDWFMEEKKTRTPMQIKVQNVYICEGCGWQSAMRKEVKAHQQTAPECADYEIKKAKKQIKYRGKKQWDIAPSMEDKILSETENPLHLVNVVLREGMDLSWIKYWRGGNSKKAMKLVDNKNMNPVMSKNPKRGGQKAPIVNAPIFIQRPQAIVDINYLGKEGAQLRDSPGWAVSPTTSMQVRVRYIDVVDVLDNGKIHVKGKKKMVNPSNRGRWMPLDELYQDVDGMYGLKERMSWNCSECGEIFDDVEIGTTHVSGHESYKRYVERKKEMEETEDEDTPPPSPYEQQRVSPRSLLWRRPPEDDDAPPRGGLEAEEGEVAELKIYESADWKHDITIVLADEREYDRLPEWRLKWGADEQLDFRQSIISNPQTTDDILIKFVENYGNNQGHRIKSPERDIESNPKARFRTTDLFTSIDVNDRWSANVINYPYILKYLLNVDGGLFIGDYQNIKPTSKIFDICVESDEFKLAAEYGLNLTGLSTIQRWVLERFGMEVPISFIYQMLTLPYIRRDIKDMATEKYRSRQIEFVEYLDLLHEHDEGGVMPND